METSAHILFAVGVEKLDIDLLFSVNILCAEKIKSCLLHLIETRYTSLWSFFDMRHKENR